MTRSDVLNLHVDPVRTEINGTQKILISHVCSTEKSKSNEFFLDKKISQVCSTDKGGSEIIIIDESTMKESESECFHKSINK